MILEASRDINLFALAFYYWPWIVVLVLALTSFTFGIITRRRRSFMAQTPPQFDFDEEEGLFYYTLPNEKPKWVEIDKPPLPENYYYSIEEGSFFYNDNENDPYWILPADINWQGNSATGASGCLTVIILIVGSIIVLANINEIHDSMPDPRGQKHRLEVYFKGQTPEGEQDLQSETFLYRPGDQFIDSTKKIHQLPTLDLIKGDDGNPNYQIIPGTTFNNSDNLIRIHIYQYETTSFMCGGGKDGQLVYALLPHSFHTLVPGDGFYKGMMGKHPSSVAITGYGGCKSIHYWGLENIAYDPASNPTSPESINKVNTAWINQN